MERPDPGTLWKKTAARTAGSSGNVITGALSVAASAALWNPLPLILWGLGATAYVLYTTTSAKHLNKTLDADRVAAERRAEEEREGLCRALALEMSEPPFDGWIASGLLPNYIALYRNLTAARRKILGLAHERQEIELVTEMGIERQLNYMLGAYLQFVKARVTYLQILAAGRPSKPPERLPPVIRQHGRVPRAFKEQEAAPGAGLPRHEDLLEELDRKIAGLREQAGAEPSTAQARQWHIDILQKQRDLVKACGERDQSVAAQLLAFPDAFSVILGQISASQVDESEVSETMGNIVEKVEQTERFVRAMGPQMDQMLSGLAAPAGAG